MRSETFWADLATLIGRFIIVFALIPNGLRKISDFATLAAGMGGERVFVGGHPFPGNARLLFPFPSFFLTCSILFDILGALLVIIGLRARPVAAWLAFYCLFAIWIYHSDFADAENVKALLRNIPLVGGLLFIAGAGPGGWSVDAWLRQRAIAAPQFATS
jgi:putative oxidoreductase